MTKELLSCVELNPEAPAVASVIWLHGLGADGNDFVPVVPALNLPADVPVRFIFPHAPVRPVAVNGGMPMRAWFDVYSMGATRDANDDDLTASSEDISRLIEREEERGISSDRIFVFGFSQGGAVGYRAALRYPRKLGGLAALSCYRINADEPQSLGTEANKSLAILVNHGEFDQVVTFALGREGYESLCAQGYQPQWQAYPMGHEVCMEQIENLSAWLQAQLKSK